MIISFNFFLPIPYGDSGSPAKSSSLVGKIFGSPNIVPPEEVKINLLQSVLNKVFISKNDFFLETESSKRLYSKGELKIKLFMTPMQLIYKYFLRLNANPSNFLWESSCLSNACISKSDSNKKEFKNSFTSIETSNYFNRKIKVGILGGSFNPAHKGHLHVSFIAKKQLNLNEIWWLVTPQNRLKQDKIFDTYFQRLKETKKLVSKYKYIKVIDA